MRLINKLIVFLIVLFSSPFVLWNITFGFIIGYLLFLIMMLGLYFSIKKRKLKPSFIAIFLGFILYMAFLPVTMTSMNAKTASYQKRVSNGQHLSFVEKYNVYGINITAFIVAFPLVPEISKECFYMMFPTQKGVREFESDFYTKESSKD